MKRKGGLDLRVLAALLVLILIAGGVALATTGGSSGAPSNKAQAQKQNLDASGLLTPVRAAPPLQLHNYLGQPVNLASYRGKAVLVTFLYTNCPDICPLITSNLRVAQNLMGAKTASKAQIIAVSVDPKGDTPKAVARFLARHEMTGRMQYLVGSASELAKVWQAWGVGSERDASQPQFINHSGLIYGITGSGKRLSIYAASFKPAEIAHDVPLLAAR
jgi:protein SCO1/2